MEGRCQENNKFQYRVKGCIKTSQCVVTLQGETLGGTASMQWPRGTGARNGSALTFTGDLDNVKQVS
jgi:hypothetical protein